MSELFRNVLNASAEGSIVIAAVLLLRLVLKKAPKKYICLLWILAGIRLLMPFSIESSLSLQPQSEIVTEVQWQELYRTTDRFFRKMPRWNFPRKHLLK